MKTAIQKIVVAICLVVLSLTSCIVGMYLLFNTSMEFKFHIAYTFVFMGTLFFSILAALLLFKKTPAKDPKDTQTDLPSGNEPTAEIPTEKPKFSFFGKKKEETIPVSDAPLTEKADDELLGMNFDPDTGEPLRKDTESGNAKLSDDSAV